MMMSTPPGYRLSKLTKRFEQIQRCISESTVLYRFLSADKLDYLCTNVLEVMDNRRNIPSSKKASVYSCLEEFLTDFITEDVMNTMCIRLAGMWDEINEGMRFCSWNDGDKPVWACLKIDSVEPLLTMKKSMYSVKATSYQGITSGCEWIFVLPRAFIIQLIKAGGGLKRVWYLPEDLQGFWLTARVVRLKGRMQIIDPQASSSQVTENKKLLKLRQDKCIGGFTEEQCFNCPLGSDECFISRHKQTYEKGICRCEKPHKHKGYIQKDGFCMECIKTFRYRAVLAKERKEKNNIENDAKNQT